MVLPLIAAGALGAVGGAGLLSLFGKSAPVTPQISKTTTYAPQTTRTITYANQNTSTFAPNIQRTIQYSPQSIYSPQIQISSPGATTGGVDASLNPTQTPTLTPTYTITPSVTQPTTVGQEVKPSTGQFSFNLGDVLPLLLIAGGGLLVFWMATRKRK